MRDLLDNINIFNKIVTYIIDKVLRQYLDMDNVKFTFGIPWISSNELKLVGATVKPNSLYDNLDLPLHVTEGRLGLLHIKLPWSTSLILNVRVSDLNVKLRSNHWEPYNAIGNEFKLQKKKQDALRIVEERIKLLNPYDNSTGYLHCLMQKQFLHLLQCCKVEVSKINVVYLEPHREDGGYSLGFRFSHLAITTPNELDKNNFKVVELSDFGVYHREKANGDNTKISSSNYILHPIKTKIDLVLCINPAEDDPPFSKPCLQAKVAMEQISIDLKRNVLLHVLDFAETYALNKAGDMYRQFRPSGVSTYRKHYKEWWWFAYYSVVETQVRRRSYEMSWLQIKHHGDLCRKYKDVYIRKLCTKTLSKEDKSLYDDLEGKLSLFSIVLMRNQAQLAVDRLKLTAAQTTFLDKFKITSHIAVVETQLTSVEKQNLHTLLTTIENEPALYPKTYIEMVVVVQLRHFELKLKTIKHTVLRTVMVDLNNIFEKAFNTWILDCKIHSLEVFGCEQTKLVQSEENFLSFLCDTGSGDAQKIDMAITPLTVTFDTMSFNDILKYFSRPITSSIVEVFHRAARHWTALGLQYILENHIRLTINIRISGPCIIIPEDGKFTQSANLIVASFGRLTIKSKHLGPQLVTVRELHEQGLQPNEIKTAMVAQIYNEYVVWLRDVVVMVVHKEEKWQKTVSAEDGFSSMYLLRPLHLRFDVDVCLVTDDPSLPWLKVGGGIESAGMYVTDGRVLLLLDIIESVLKKISRDSLKSSKTPQKDSITPFYTYNEELAVKNFLRDNAREQQQQQQHIFTIKQIAFDIKELYFICMHEKNFKSPPIELLRFKITQIKSIFIKKTYSTAIRVSAKSIMMNQHLKDKVCVGIITTRGVCSNFDGFFHMQFVQTDKKDPSFHQNNSVESCLTIDMATISLILNQDALLALIDFGGHINRKFKKVRGIMAANASKDAKPEITETLHSSIGNNTLSHGTTIKSPAMHVEKQKADVIKLVASFHFSKFAINLQTDLKYISSFEMSGMSGNLISRVLVTKFDLELAVFTVTDMNKGNLYPKIVYHVKDQKAIRLEVAISNSEDESKKFDVSVKGSAACLEICFLNYYIMNMVNFANSLNLAKIRALRVPVLVAEKSKARLSRIDMRPLKLALDIKIHAPKITIPESSTTRTGIIIDCGTFTAENKINNIHMYSEHSTLVMDEITLQLDRIRVERFQMNESMEVIATKDILQPCSITVEINRNLSMWCTFMPAIDVAVVVSDVLITIGQNDYQSIAKIMTNNMNESPTVTAECKPSQDTNKKNSSKKIAIVVTKNDKENVHATRNMQMEDFEQTKAKWCFSVDLIQLELYTSADNQFEGSKKSFCELAVLGVTMQGQVRPNNVLSASFLLGNIVLKDVREESDKSTNCFLSKDAKDGEGDMNKNDSAGSNLIDVSIQHKQAQTVVDIYLISFTFILSMEFYAAITQFFEMKNFKLVSRTTDTLAATITSSTPKVVTKKNTIIVTIRMDTASLLMAENVYPINSKAITLNFNGLLMIRICGSHINLSGKLDDFQINTCVFDPRLRDSTKNVVLQQLAIVIAGTTSENSGLHTELFIDQMHLNASMYIIELFKNIFKTVTVPVQVSEPVQNVADYSNLWATKMNKECKFWFVQNVKNDETCPRSYEHTVGTHKSYKDVCVVCVRTISVTLTATSDDNKALPLLQLKSHAHVSFADWTSELSMSATVGVQLNYYNSVLRLWEPIIEPVQAGGKITPWECNITMSTDKIVETITDNKPVAAAQTFTNFDITSTSSLELTVTKTGLDVLAQVGRYMSDTSNAQEIVRATQKHHQLINLLGTPIKVLLDESDFVQIQHKQTVVTLGSDETILLDVKGGAEGSKLLRIELADDIIDLDLSTHSIRFYPFHDAGDSVDKDKGILTNVIIQKGVIAVTISGILQIHNKFGIPIVVQTKQKHTNDREIRIVQPRTYVHLPISWIYSDPGDIWLSLNDLPHTGAAYVQVWDTAPRYVSCTVSSGKHMGTLYMLISSEKTSPFYKNTSVHAKKVFIHKIYVQPAIHLTNCLPVTIKMVCPDAKSGRLLMPGDKIVVTNVNPEQTDVVMIIANYLDLEWISTVRIGVNEEELKTYVFKSRLNKEITLDITVRTNHIDEQSPLSVLVFCPFWLINKTELQLTYSVCKSSNLLHADLMRCCRKTTQATVQQMEQSMELSNKDVNKENKIILLHPLTYKGAILCGYNDKNGNIKKHLRVKVDDGEFSKKICVNKVGDCFSLVCKKGTRMYYLGVQVHLMSNGLTKQVTFTPFHLINNMSQEILELQLCADDADSWTAIEPNSCIPLYTNCSAASTPMRLRVKGTKEETIPFLVTKPQRILLKLTNKYGGINLHVNLTNAGVYINVSLYQPGMAPCLIVNETPEAINFGERESPTFLNIPSGHNAFFTWSQQSPDSRILTWKGDSNETCETRLTKDEHGEYNISENRIVHWVTFQYGLQRILLLTTNSAILSHVQNHYHHYDTRITVAIAQIGVSLINSTSQREVVYIKLYEHPSFWESRKGKSEKFSLLSDHRSAELEEAYKASRRSMHEQKIIDQSDVDFEQMTAGKKHRTIRRWCQDGLWAQIKLSEYLVEVCLKIHRLQVDNQMYSSRFPVVVSQVLPVHSVAEETRHDPFVKVIIIQHLNDLTGYRHFKKVSLVMQEFHLKLNYAFVNVFREFFNTSQNLDQIEKHNFLAEQKRIATPLHEHVTKQSLIGRADLYESFYIAPVQLHLSFAVSTNDFYKFESPNNVGNLLLEFCSTFLNMNDMQLKIDAFSRENVFLTQGQLVKQTLMHCVMHLVKLINVSKWFVDIISKPHTIALNMAKGVKDLVMEPCKGATHSPLKLLKGLCFGLTSFLSHTVGGVSEGLSRLIGAMGKGLTSLCFDKIQVKQRQANYDMPTEGGQRFASGGKELGKGLIRGVEQLIKKPRNGYKENGMKGLLVGLGQGIAGFVVSPPASVLDFVSCTLEGVKEVTAVDGAAKHRWRAPRYIHQDGSVKPYDAHKAEGQMILMELQRGTFSTSNIYSCHFYIHKETDVLLLSDNYLFYLRRAKLSSVWQIHWKYVWENVATATQVAGGIKIECKLDKGAKHQIIHIEDEALQLAILNAISVQQEYM